MITTTKTKFADILNDSGAHLLPPIDYKFQQAKYA